MAIRRIVVRKPLRLSGSQTRAVVAKKEESAIRLKVQIEPTSDVPVQYANYVEVGHSEHEFTLSMTRIPSKFSSERLAEATASGVLSMPPDIQVLLPPTVIPPLIRALKTQQEKYEEHFGKIAKSEEESE